MAKTIDWTLQPIRCGTKKGFAKEHVAKARAQKSAAITGESWSAYLCEFCGLFHIGHTPKSVKSEQERRRRRDLRIREKRRMERQAREDAVDQAQETRCAVLDPAGAADSAG